MSFMSNLTDLWQANGQEPHETQGPAPQAPDVPRGTHEHFDPLSEGASKAIHQVRKNVGYKKPSNMRPLVELLGNLGNAGLRSSDSLMAQELGQQGFNPYAAEEARAAQNMQIMQFLAKQEEARKIHEFKQQEMAQYQALQQQKLAQEAQHNQTMKDYYSNRGAAGTKQYAPSNLGKLYQERDAAVEAFGEGSPQAQSYDLAIQKATTDTDVRNRTLFASNLEKTLDMIKVEDLVRYSGVKGALKLKAEQAKDLAGHPSEEYLRYKDAVGQQQLASDQIKQFLKGANSEKALQHFENLSNPSKWSSSPEAAKRQLESSKKVLRNELDTYHGSVTSTKEYRPSAQQHHIAPESASQIVTISNKKTGETRQVTLEEARALGATSE